MEKMENIREYIQNMLLCLIKTDWAINILIMIGVLLVLSIICEIFKYINKLVLHIFGIIALIVQCIVYIIRNGIIVKNKFNTKILGDIPILYGEISKIFKQINDRIGIEYHYINGFESMNIEDIPIEIEIIGVDIKNSTMDIRLKHNDIVKKVLCIGNSKKKTKELVSVRCNDSESQVMEDDSFKKWWEYLKGAEIDAPKLSFKLINLNSTTNNINIMVSNNNGKVSECTFEINCTPEEIDFLEKYNQLTNVFLARGKLIVLFMYILQITWGIIFLLFTGSIIGTIILVVIFLFITNIVVNYNDALMEDLDRRIKEVKK